MKIFVVLQMMWNGFVTEKSRGLNACSLINPILHSSKYLSKEEDLIVHQIRTVNRKNINL